MKCDEYTNSNQQSAGVGDRNRVDETSSRRWMRQSAAFEFRGHQTQSDNAWAHNLLVSESMDGYQRR
jgi:hypothetical protein